ncbi:beta-lactamase family protein [Alcaligenes sp. SORT26]|uniref:serine hydrolase domain-containing protein n=1 Tax=Alcaligenes sp. SORT26 TaxID=2813780 RepID=UPI001A9FB6E1|nr:serine hydrolase domain-containing protein [Alcaligenes sp. SORT26]QTC00628.1 beta-lactamase family protein [Alcaligenes sp. SORT26]
MLKIRLKKASLALALAALSATAMPVMAVTQPATPESVQSSRALAELSRYVQEMARKVALRPNFSSLQYALIENNTVVLSGYAGENDTPLDHETVYAIGSVSKMFGAASVMKLVQDGKLDLDTPIYQYLPDFRMADPRYQQITARMLLNHSAGLRGDDVINDSLFMGDNNTKGYEYFLDTLALQTLNADPGAFSVYCNSCFTLAEKLVEQVSGQSFTDYIQSSFNEPLGMRHTSTPVQGPGDNYARLKWPGRDGGLPWIHYNVIASGGVNSTAEDMAKFARLFMQDGPDLLSPQSREAMQAPEYLRGFWPEDRDDSGNYGLGWDSVKLYPFNDLGIQALAKGGDISAHHAILVVLPKLNMAAVVLSAGGNSGTNQLMATRILLKALELKGFDLSALSTKSFPVEAGASMPPHLLSYAGVYGDSGSLMQVDIQANGALRIETGTQETEHYQYAGQMGFVDAKRAIRIEFVEAANGHTYLWDRRYEMDKGLGQNAESAYRAQKLPPNLLDEATQAVWAQRDGLRYFPLKYLYNSEYYFVDGLPGAKLALSKELAGYVGALRIRDAYTAASEVQIPGQAGRETQHASFELHDGQEYLLLNNDLMLSEQAIPTLSTKTSRVQIGTNGFAQWFLLGDQTAEQTLNVTLAAKSAYAVYDKEGACVHYSLLDGAGPVRLPKKGSIVFAGSPAAVFELSIP